MKKADKSKAAAFRDKAENVLKNHPSEVHAFSSEIEIRKLAHELSVYQTELEKQIEELRIAKEAAVDYAKKYVELYDLSPSGYLTLSKEGNITELNLTFAEMLGVERSQLIEIRFGLFISNDSLSVFNFFLENIFRFKGRDSCEVRLLPKRDGLMYATLTGIANESENLCSVTVIDITERKRAEETINKNEAILNIFVKHSPAAIAMFDTKMRYIVASARFREDYDLSDEEIIGRSHYEIFPEIPDRWKEIHNRCLSGVTERCEEDPFPRASGKLDWIRWEICPWYDGKGQIGGIIFFSEVITESIKAYKEIHKSREQLAQLQRHLNVVREEERTSIAREIHDDLGQALAGLKIDLLGMKEDINEKVWPKQKIDKAISLVNTTIKSVQKLTSQLRPQLLDELGLASAIEWQANEFIKRTGIECKLELEEIDLTDENIPISLFRIFQAALTNIMLHSKAKSISVKLAIKDELLTMKVLDDGIGITHKQIESSKSFGIIGMRERTYQINGRFEIHSQTCKGTEIIITVPLNGNKDPQ